MQTSNPSAPDLPAERGLVLVGYVAAGQPETLHEVYIRPERWPERRRLVLQANGRPANLTKLDPTDE